MKQASWTKRIRDALPEKGDTSIIITGPSGVEYVSLSRDLVDAEQQRSERKQLIHKSTTRLFILSIVVMIAYHLVAVANMQRSISITNLQLDALTSPLKDFEEEFPQHLLTSNSENETDYVGIIEAIKRLVVLQDESFRFYIESTRMLLDRDGRELRDELAGFGLVEESLVNGAIESAVGGFAALDEINDLLSYYIQDPLLDMLDEHGKVLDLVHGLPTGRPMRNSILTSKFGVRRHPISGKREPHNGIDVLSYSDPTVRATGHGVIKAVGRNGGYGNSVVVDHGNRLETVYAHLSAIHVQEGDTIEEGQVVGIMGSTGNSTGKHLHYEIRIDNKSVDPLRFIGKFDYVLQ